MSYAIDWLEKWAAYSPKRMILVIHSVKWSLRLQSRTIQLSR